jgi:predicted metalloendopeptidase
VPSCAAWSHDNAIPHRLFVVREDAPRPQLLTNLHSPGEHRVNGVLRNIPEFHAAFNTKPGDRMYLAPEQRVKIW